MSEQIAASKGRTPEVIAGEIHYLQAQCQRLVLGHAIEIGRRLVEAKAMLAHGSWGGWLEENFGYSQRQAQDLMKIFEEYGADQIGLLGAEIKTKTFADLGYSKALALLAVPKEEREEFAGEVRAEELSVRELKKAIAERDEARRREQEAQQALEREQVAASQNGQELEAKRRELQIANSRLVAHNEETEALRRRIQELEQRPVEVAVQHASPEELEAARKEGAEQRAKEVETMRGKLEKAKKAKKEAEEERERLEEELQALKGRMMAEHQRQQKQAAARSMDEGLKEFSFRFRQVQQDFEALTLQLEQLDPDQQGKMRTAVRALLDKLCQDMEG